MTIILKCEWKYSKHKAKQENTINDASLKYLIYYSCEVINLFLGLKNRFNHAEKGYLKYYIIQCRCSKKFYTDKLTRHNDATSELKETTSICLSIRHLFYNIN